MKKIQRNLILKHAVKIQTSPEKIWQFFLNLEQNYTTWHPKDHILFQWTEGEALFPGSKYYSEQYMGGKKVIYKGEVAESIKNKKVVLTFSFPMSMIAKGIEWIMEEEEDYTIFTALTKMKLGWIFRTFYPQQVMKLIKDHNEHVAFEGEKLKTILEND